MRSISRSGLAATIFAICLLLPIASYAAERSPVMRDLDGYAIATCLSLQSQPYLKRQGDDWGSIVMQRAAGAVALFDTVSEAVKAQLRREGVGYVHVDADPPRDEAAPVAYCGEIIDRPLVRRAIDQVRIRMAPDYRRR